MSCSAAEILYALEFNNKFRVAKKKFGKDSLMFCLVV